MSGRAERHSLNRCRPCSTLSSDNCEREKDKANANALSKGQTRIVLEKREGASLRALCVIEKVSIPGRNVIIATYKTWEEGRGHN